MSRLLLSALVAFSWVAGCRSVRLSPTADQNWLRDLNRADSIVLGRQNVEHKISDREAITRLARIYSTAEWKTYLHTLPGNLDDRTIDICLNGSKLRHMSYTGILWEIQNYESNRVASISIEDCEWIESLFDFLSTAETESAR